MEGEIREKQRELESIQPRFQEQKEREEDLRTR